MRHRIKGRKLNRNHSHRKAMFSNMAASLIRTLEQDEDQENQAKVPGRIVTTVPKAKELRPRVERLITIAKKAISHEQKAEEFATSADRGTDEWKQWRNSEQWQQWTQARAPAIALRRRAFAILRDRTAVDILFDDLAERFSDRDGGYTRVVRLASRRLGDAGQQALIEFVGENDRVRASSKKSSSLAVKDEDESAEEPAADEGSADTDAGTESSAETESDAEGAADDAATTDEPTAEDSSESEGEQAGEEEGKASVE